MTDTNPTSNLVSGLSRLGNPEGESWVTLRESEAAAVCAELSNLHSEHVRDVERMELAAEAIELLSAERDKLHKQLLEHAEVCGESAYPISDRLAVETAGDDARDAARYRYLRERLACDRLAARKLVITTEGGREPYRTLREAELDREIDECIGLSVERTPPHPGPSIERAFANSPRRVKEPEAVRAGVSVKDPTPPQDIILCAAMGPSGFICERPKGHPGRHCDGDNRSWSPEKANAFQCVCGEMHTLSDGHVCTPFGSPENGT